MKKIILITGLILLAVAGMYNASRVHHKVYDKCTREWEPVVKKETMAECRPVNHCWHEMPVSRMMKLVL